MFDRRIFLRASAGAPLALSLPMAIAAQSDAEKPDFTVAGSAITDPPGYEIAWSNDWHQQDIDRLSFEPVPGNVGYIVLDLPDGVAGSINVDQRIVIRSVAATEIIDPEWLLNSFADNHPSAEFGYAPGTVVETRSVTDQGCWFSFGAGEDSFVPGVVGLALFYTPQQAGDPLLEVIFNLRKGELRSPSHLEFVDATISLNGNWLLGMDELQAYWEAIESSIGFDL